MTHFAWGQQIARAPDVRAPFSAYLARCGLSCVSCRARPQAAAESHVLDHACRIVLRGLEAEATAAPKSVQRVGRSPDMDMPTLLGHFHLAINKVRGSRSLQAAACACCWVACHRACFS